MLLAIDIGNTNITCGVFSGKKLVKRFNIPTNGYNGLLLKRKIARICIDKAIVCSVVPAVGNLLEKDLRKAIGKNVFVLGHNLTVPIINKYKKPKQVGQDRLVNAYAGIMLYGAPLIVVDFGTAITFDVISKDKAYLGGLILPGLQTSLSALSEKTALLPRVKLFKPSSLIGRDTKSSMTSGVVNGFAALTDSVTKRIKKDVDGKMMVIGTGGDIALIRSLCTCFDNIDHELTLKGISLLQD